MEKYQSQFIMNLKYYRELRGLSQAALAGIMECGTGTIGNLEAGSSKPSFDLIVKIAYALEVEPCDLFMRNSSTAKKEIDDFLRIELPKHIKDIADKRFPLSQEN
nr:helix-turn-helix transcriptional regulator [Treponema sp.]